MENKIDQLNNDELVPAPVDLTKLNDAVKNDVVKKDAYNVKLKNIENKIPGITNLATNNTLNAKIKKIKNEIPNLLSNTNLATTAALTTFEN